MQKAETGYMDYRAGHAADCAAEDVLSATMDDFSIRHHDNPCGLPIRKILIPTNFSPGSACALERAVALAGQCNAALTILHVVDINAKAELGSAAEIIQRLWNEGSDKIGKLACSLASQVDAQTTMLEGLPWEEIVDKSAQFDLVVLGKSNGGRGARFFSPHTVQRVVENSACPVLVVSERSSAGSNTTLREASFV